MGISYSDESVDVCCVNELFVAYSFQEVLQKTQLTTCSKKKAVLKQSHQRARDKSATMQW